MFGHKGYIPPTEVTDEELMEDLPLSQSLSSSSSTVNLDEKTSQAMRYFFN